MTDRDPYIRRYMIALKLRELRERARLTQDEVAHRLGYSRSKIVRIEASEHGVTRVDLDALLTLYGIDLLDPIRHNLHVLQRNVRQRGWWEEFRPIDPRFIEVEGAASTIHGYAGTVIPGLLQTRDYSLELLKVARPDLDSDQIVRQVALRQERQRRILGSGRNVCIVLDEAALRRRYGTVHTMTAVYRRILDHAEIPGVTVLVLPFSAPSPPVMGNLALLTVPLGSQGEPATFAHIETIAGDLFVSDPATVGTMADIHAQLRTAALGPDESRRLVVRHMEGLGHA